MVTIESYSTFAEPVQQYLRYVQRAVVLNLDVATKWTELVTAFSGAGQVGGEQVGFIVQGSAVVTDQVTAEPIAPPTDEVDDAEREQALEAERAEAKHAHLLAREPYRGMTKNELSTLLAERGLPKTGTVNVLVERLVAADAPQ